MKWLVAEKRDDGMYALSDHIVLLEEILRDAIRDMSEGQRIGSINGIASCPGASYYITAFEFDDNGLQAEVDILNTPNGLLLKQRIDNGLKTKINFCGYFDNYDKLQLLSNNVDI